MTALESELHENEIQETESHSEEAAHGPAISLPAEEVAKFGNYSLTNGITAGIICSILIIAVAVFIRAKIGVAPSKRQVAFEMLFVYFLDKLTEETGSEKVARRILPIILSLFIFILLANQFFLLPLFGSIITPDHHHVFRVPTSDYSLTIGLALLVVFLSHLFALMVAPMNHISHYIKYRPLLNAIKNFKLSEIPMALLDLFLGLLEIVGEFARVVSLGTRLFGIIFSGEVIVMIVSSLAFFTQFVVPIPFLALGVLAGTIHAFVFSTLALLFIGGNVRNAASHH